MRPPPDLEIAAAKRASRTLLLGWFVAANVVAVAIALLGASPATAADAAHQVAVWCGIG